MELLEGEEAVVVGEHCEEGNVEWAKKYLPDQSWEEW